MKARVHVFYKEGVFDPQGNTVGEALRQNGFSKVTQARVGKVIDLELMHQNVEEARRDIRQMCEKMLANPVIESFSYEIRE